MLKRLMAGLAAVGVVLSGLVVSASPASATGTCSLRVPSRVSLYQVYHNIPVSLGPDCAAAGVVSAAWNGYNKQGRGQALSFNSTITTNIWRMYGISLTGRYEWRPIYARDRDFNAVYQYGPYYTDVRLASWGRVTVTRYGSKVTVRTSAAWYWPSGNKFIAWTASRGQIQWRRPGTTTWYGLKDVYSSSGFYSYTYTTSAIRDYRVVLYSTPRIWGLASPVVRK